MWRYVKSKLYGVAVVVTAIVGAASPAIAVATSEIQSSICADFMAPTITSPASDGVTQDDSVIIAGQGEPSLPVTITDNDISVAVVSVSSSGEYSVSIPLSGGDNTIIAKEVNTCETAKESSAINIHRDIVEPAPSASGVTAQDPGPTGIIPIALTQSPSGLLNQPIPGNRNTEGFNAPVIKQPLSGAAFTTSVVWVSGTAEPLSMVTIYINGMSVARLRVSSTGSFSVTVDLNTGSNSIQVEAEKDGKSAFSQAVVATYTPPSLAEKGGTSPLTVAAWIGGSIVAAAVVVISGEWIVRRIGARRLR